MFEQFNQIVSSWAHEVAKDEKNEKVFSIIQFGSTCIQPLKKNTDIDLIYILNKEEKPTKKEAYEITLSWDLSLEKELKKIKNHNIIVNSHLKIIKQLDHLSPMYLDFPDCSKILFDRNNHATKLISDIQNWIKKNGARKINKGQLWYWIYDDKDPNEPVNFKFL